MTFDDLELRKRHSRSNMKYKKRNVLLIKIQKVKWTRQNIDDLRTTFDDLELNCSSIVFIPSSKESKHV